MGIKEFDPRQCLGARYDNVSQQEYIVFRTIVFSGKSVCP